MCQQMRFCDEFGFRLAQEFSTAESPRFVNGILDAVYKEMRADITG